MSCPKECQEFAYEGLGWATTAKFEAERERYLRVARAWLNVAGRLEGLIQDSVSAAET